MEREKLIKEIRRTAIRMRKHSLDMALVAGSNGAHLGPGYSMAELTAALYKGVMHHDPENPKMEDRDRFVLSKGHGVLGYFPILAECGYFPVELLKTFETLDSPLAGHPSIHQDMGIDFSTGSLGHGLSLGVGLALGARQKGSPSITYVYMGDGETNEGSVWEAAMAAKQFRLSNLVAVIDHNRIQSDGFSRDIMDLERIEDMWKAFGWKVRVIDGHNVEEILDAFQERNRASDRPYMVIARTVKGKGATLFENDNTWHHNKLTQEQYDEVMKELNSWEESLCR